MQRRTFLAGGASAVAMMTAKATMTLANTEFAHLNTASGKASATAAHVRGLAQELSRTAFRAPSPVLPAGFTDIGYDQYRDIRFRPDRAVWRSEELGFELQFFATGYIYPSPVEIFLVDKGAIRPFIADPALFDFGPLASAVAADPRLSLSGFRVHAPINRPKHYDELLAFQGASYFRGLGKTHQYGLSARALALNTAGPEAEEFPLFRSYWIERPDGPGLLTIHALLDSPSVTGAYTFVVAPGRETVVYTSAVLYPRRDLMNVGIAPLTSMFLKAPHDARGSNDFRPSVHDSDGLAVWNGRNERLWRPLRNPTALQVSCFRDDNPKGFGLIQRARHFEDYQDLEARYEQRPSAWIEPEGSWGAGCVELVEIPSPVEYTDNIVAYWRPDAPLQAGQAYPFAYRLSWCDDVAADYGLRVQKTRIGEGSKPGTVLFALDFAGSQERVRRAVERVASNNAFVTDVTPLALPDATVTASVGTVSTPVVQPNPHVRGIRVVFELDTQGEKVIELRLSLDESDEGMAETWLYRWTA